MRPLLSLLIAGLLALPAGAQDGAADFGPGGSAAVAEAPADTEAAPAGAADIEPSADRKIALLIGNREYPDQIGDLATPHLDVTTLTAALDATGFETYPHFDAERDEMVAAIKTYRDRLAEAKLNGGKVFGFVYIAGQGFSVGDEMGNRNLLMASRKHVWSADDLMKQAVDLEDSVSTVLSAQPDALFVVVDSAREGLQLSFNDPARPTGFMAYPPQPGLVIAYSSAPGERAPDDGEFAKTLAREIVRPDQLATVAINKALAAVAETTPSRGAPYIDLGRLDTPVCFNGCPAIEDEEEEIDLANMRPPTSSVTLDQPKAPTIPLQALTSLVSGDEGAAQAANSASGASAGGATPSGSATPSSGGTASRAGVPGSDPNMAQTVVRNATSPGVQAAAQQAAAASGGNGLLGSAANVGAGAVKATAGAASNVASTAASTVVGTQVAAVQAVQTQATIGAATAAAGVAASGVKAGVNIAGAGLKALTGGGSGPAGDAVKREAASQAARPASSSPPVRQASVSPPPGPANPPAPAAPASSAPVQKAANTSPSPVPSNSVTPSQPGLQTVSATSASPVPPQGAAPSSTPTADSIREAFENSRQSSETAAEQIADAEAAAQQQAAEQQAPRPDIGRAVATRQPRPAYPEEALAQDIEGLCDVKFDLDTEGVPFNVTASCTDSVFEQESVRALSDARFEKTLIEGRPAIRKGVTYPLEYKLQ